jgi:hypothetical protein
MDALSSDAPPANYRKWVEDLKKEREQRKQALTRDMESEFEKRVKGLRDDIINKYTQEANLNTDEEIEALLREQNPGMQGALSELKK